MTDWTNIPWNNFPYVKEPNAKISANFRLKELYASKTADAKGINNWFPSSDHLRSAVFVCRQVLQKVRDEFGSFSPNSVFRNNELDRVLKRKPSGWQSRSQHTRGQACDFEVVGLANLDLAIWIRDNLTFDQLILEKHNPQKGSMSGWVHVSLLPPNSEKENRGDVLSYIFDPTLGKYIYVQGLQTTP